MAHYKVTVFERIVQEYEYEVEANSAAQRGRAKPSEGVMTDREKKLLVALVTDGQPISGSGVFRISPLKCSLMSNAATLH